MSKAGLWTKMIAAGIGLGVGGPYLIYWVTPTEEELFKRYNPDLQRRSLENRTSTQQNFDDFVGKLKEYSRSDKPIWEAVAEAEAKMKVSKAEEAEKRATDIQKRKEEIKRHSISPE